MIETALMLVSIAGLALVIALNQWKPVDGTQGPYSLEDLNETTKTRN